LGVKIFSQYAECYDALYQGKDYQSETRFVLNILRKHGVRGGAILELGCGTGAYTHLFARHHSPVVGVDFSSAMLTHAKMKLERLPEKSVRRIHFHHGDIRTIRLRRKFNAVVALFHVLSYLDSNRDLAATFETASRHLSDGGLFLCDFWYGPGVLSEPPEHRTKKVENAEHSIIRTATPELYPSRNAVLVCYDITYLNKQQGIRHRIKENHLMRYLFKPEIEELCHGAGFQLVQFGEWMSGKEPTLKTWNAYLVARRKQPKH
jgi:ubiquinone/menaquinone biosynthesis C-methylase UbiE